MARPEITEELIRKTAALAQLEVTDKEVQRLLPRVRSFLGFVESINAVADSGGGGADSAMEAVGVVVGGLLGDKFLQTDTPEKFAGDGDILANMPVEEGGYLRVPRVGEEASD
ncbi:unnamed protein product [Phaeothamnion confervicola]